MIAERKETNRVMVDEKSEWLFIVGRDLFKRGILRASGSQKKGAYTLVVNQQNENLGFGRIVCSLDEKERKHEVAVRNISDIGDFLRREKRFEWSEKPSSKRSMARFARKPDRDNWRQTF